MCDGSPSHDVGVRRGAIGYRNFHSIRVQGLLQRSASRKLGVRLRSRRCGSGSLVHAPVVQDARDMPDGSAFACEPQRKIVILCAIEALAEPAYLRDELAFCNEEVPEVHAGRQQLGGPVRFEVWPRSLPCLVHPVFVGIQDIGLVILQSFDYEMQGCRGQHIILIEECQVIAIGERPRSVQG